MPDNPHIEVEIRGASRAGKTTVGAILREVLRNNDVNVSGPDVVLPRFEHAFTALAGLRKRGFSVTIIETHTGAVEQVDARVGFAGLPYHAQNR